MKTILAIIAFTLALNGYTQMETNVGKPKEINVTLQWFTNVFTKEFDFELIITNAIKEKLITTNMIVALCASGEVCRVKGHNWRGGRPEESANLIFLDYHPNTSYRTCDLCGVCQKQDLTWK